MTLNVKGSGGGIVVKGSGAGLKLYTSTVPGTFSIEIDEFTSENFGEGCSADSGSGVNGFVSSGVHQIIWNNYILYNPADASTTTKLDAAWSAVGLSPSNYGYVWNVSWGPGSSQPTGLVRLVWTGTYFVISPIDPADTRYLSGNQASDSLPGTYLFPATFTPYLPLITEGNGWC